MKWIRNIIKTTILFLAQIPVLVSAQGVNPLKSLTDVGQQVYGNASPPDIKVTIGKVVQILLGFIGILFVVLIIVGGFRWMTSGGNEQKIDEAKRLITNATIGLVVVVLAYSIAFSVTKWLSTATSVNSSVVPGSGSP